MNADGHLSPDAGRGLLTADGSLLLLNLQASRSRMRIMEAAVWFQWWVAPIV